MKRIARTNQGGSVVTFAVIGTILVALLAGGVYYAYQRGSHVRSGEPLIGSTERKTAAPEVPKSSDGNSSNTSDNTDNTNQTPPQTNTSTPGSSTQPQSSSPDLSSSQAPAKIPQTGPADTTYLLISLAIVAFVTTRYLRSRASLRAL